MMKRLPLTNRLAPGNVGRWNHVWKEAVGAEICAGRADQDAIVNPVVGPNTDTDLLTFTHTEKGLVLNEDDQTLRGARHLQHTQKTRVLYRGSAEECLKSPRAPVKVLRVMSTPCNIQIPSQDTSSSCCTAPSQKQTSDTDRLILDHIPLLHSSSTCLKNQKRKKKVSSSRKTKYDK